MAEKIRIATFNVENLDDKEGESPTLSERIAVMRPQLLRMKADILCLQEVHGQKIQDGSYRLLALNKLLENTPYAQYHRASTTSGDGDRVDDKRNIVILSRFDITEHAQYLHNFAPAPRYQKVTSDPPETEDNKITWERPIVHAKISLAGGRVLNIINVHMKSMIPTEVKGQKIDNYTWKTASGWAEGYFVSSMKRVGQAMEIRMFIDKLFDEDENSFIVVCGDFNADSDNVPVLAIRGDVENTGNGVLAGRVMVPCERTIPESSRFSLLHQGKGVMLDHLLVSRSMLAYYTGSEIHNELLHDESIAFAMDTKFPESDHAPIIAEFEIPGN